MVIEDIEILDFNPDNALPERMILTNVSTSPLPIIPSIALDCGKNQ